MDPVIKKDPTYSNLSEYKLMPNLMQIIFDPSKHSPPNDFLNNLKKRLDQYHNNQHQNKNIKF
tara:strand:+ start:457 stop:645 length:189 start_codon:yes stop_codon:yes gene_type:complete